MLSIKKLRSRWVSKKNFIKFFYFGLIGGFGTILNTGILYLLSQKAGMNYLIAAVIATEIAIISNFIGNNYLTFRNQNNEENIYKKFLSFQLISLVTLFGTIFFLWLFVTMFGSELLLVWNLIAILIMFVANFVLNSAFTWKAKKMARMGTITGKPKNTHQEKRKNAKGHTLHTFILLFGISILFALLLTQSSLAKPPPNSNAHNSNAMEENLSVETNDSLVITNETSGNNDSLLLDNTTDELNATQNSTESDESFDDDIDDDFDDDIDDDIDDESDPVDDTEQENDNSTATDDVTNTTQEEDSPALNDTNSTLVSPINVTNTTNTTNSTNTTNTTDTTGDLHLLTEPGMVNITINDTTKTTNNNGELTIYNLTTGTKTITATKTNHTTISTQINIQTGNNYINITLQPIITPPTNTTNTTNSTNTTGNLYILTDPGQVNVSYNQTPNSRTYATSNANGIVHLYNLTTGTISINATKTDYTSFSTQINILPGDNFINIILQPIITPPTNTTNSTNTTNTTDTTGDLHLLTEPGMVNITINDTTKTTNNNGELTIYNLTTGTKTITATKTNHTTISTQINIQTGNNYLNITLQPIITPPTNTTNTTNSTNTTRITGTSTSIPSTTIHGSTQYFLREDDTSTFLVTSNIVNNITWFVDGIEKNTTTGKTATFVWTPGVLWVPRAPTYANTVVSTVKAQTATESVSWTIHVENVINPFFSSKNDEADVLGSIDSKIHVLMNNKYLDFTHVNVTLSSSSGNTVYQLQKTFNNSNETEWTKYIPTLVPGNNYLTHIFGFNNITGQNTTYHIGSARAHYVQPPSKEPSESSKSSGGGGSSRSQPFNPEVIYALFGKDVVNSDESQTLTLDAKNFNGGVYSVQAKLTTPQDTFQTVTLTLVNGTKEYGTWTTTFKPALTGEYSLYSVTLGGSNKATSKEITIHDHTFYYFDQNISLAEVTEELGLIYTILSHSEVRNGTRVKLTLDARDYLGILNVSAEIQDTKQHKFSIPLKLVKGESTYGTWEGTFTGTTPDTTYHVRSVTMSNAHDEKTYTLQDRSVYVFPVSNQEQITEERQNRITGAAIMAPFSSDYWYEIMKKPLVPTLAGFGIMIFVIAGVFLLKRK